MREFLALFVELLAYAVAGVGLAAAGVFAELTSVSYYTAGNTVFAVWLAVMGLVALYAGVVGIGLGELLPRIQTLRAGDESTR